MLYPLYSVPIIPWKDLIQHRKEEKWEPIRNVCTPFNNSISSWLCCTECMYKANWTITLGVKMYYTMLLGTSIYITFTLTLPLYQIAMFALENLFNSTVFYSCIMYNWCFSGHAIDYFELEPVCICFNITKSFACKYILLP